MAKVCYRLIEPGQYQGKHALVVGGGDSALEAALSLAEEPGTTVTLAHRSEVFTGAKRKTANASRRRSRVAGSKSDENKNNANQGGQRPSGS